MDIIKCSSCNIVINEVLVFIQNKIKVMDNLSLIRVCVTGFSESDVTYAKSLLFDAVKPNIKMVKRRCEGKMQRELEDIITVFKETDPEKFPIFVARDLYKLPPISFDHIDVTGLLKELLMLREEVNTIKTTYVTKDMLGREQKSSSCCSSQLTPSPPLNRYRNINVNKRGASKQSFEIDSGPTGFLHSINESQVNITPPSRTSPFINDFLTKDDESKGASTESSSNAEVTSPTKLPHQRSPQLPQASLPGETPPTQPPKSLQHVSSVNKDVRPTMAEVLKEGEWKKSQPDQEWIEVQRRRHRNRLEYCTGKAPSKQTCNFKAAESKVPLYISNVHVDTTEKDITDYVYENTKERVKLISIKMKQDKGYKSYKLWVSKEKVNMFLNEQLWPIGISFRHFVYFKNFNAGDTDLTNNNSNG